MQPKETCSASNIDYTSRAPHQNDGDFLSLEPAIESPEDRPFPRPIYSNPVREGGVSAYGKVLHDGDMRLQRYEVTMENGATYDVSMAMSERPGALDIAHL